ncbi:MAG: LptF/LptG family permease [Gemmataceae bacterium]|nr:LptF/LptG family permease [Gemmataceae bacterium]
MLFGSTLNRTIFSELVKVFLMALGALTGLFLLAGLIQQASQLGLSPMQVLTVIPLFVPSTLPYTIPATTLFASCVVYGRLAHDNEVVAVKAAGVHLFTILKPALALGVATTAVTAWLYYSVIPETQQQFQREILKDPEEMMYNQLRRERCFKPTNFPYAIYVRDVQGRRLLDMVLKQRAKARNPQSGAEVMTGTGYETVLWTREARLRIDVAEGKLYIDPDRFVIYNHNTHGVSQRTGPLQLDLPDALTAAEGRNRPMSLPWDGLGPRIVELEQDRADKEAKRADAWEKTARLPESDFKRTAQAQQDGHYKAQIENVTRMIRNVEAEYYMRPALAAGCLVFALIGCPVGIWANRADYLSTFVICFLPSMFVYYPLLLAGSNMGKDGKLPLGLGCWAANIVVGAAGLVLTWRLLRR